MQRNVILGVLAGRFEQYLELASICSTSSSVMPLTGAMHGHLSRDVSDAFTCDHDDNHWNMSEWNVLYGEFYSDRKGDKLQVGMTNRWNGYAVLDDPCNDRDRVMEATKLAVSGDISAV